MSLDCQPKTEPDDSETGSPFNRFKFLCSHGGKILPRPADGHLKYVGGETRVISVPRDISFPELTKKLREVVDGEMVLKYQLMAEDLDALVSVKSEEDFRHMVEEHDPCETTGCSRLRTFLFPLHPVMENPTGVPELQTLEQCYIDALNGIVRPATPPPTLSIAVGHKQISRNYGHVSYGFSSACTSPKSTSSGTGTPEAFGQDSLNSRLAMQRVGSTPILCSVGSNHNIHQHHYPLPQCHKQLHQTANQLSRTPPTEPYRGGGGGVQERLTVRLLRSNSRGADNGSS